MKRTLSDFEFERGKKGMVKTRILAFEVMKVMFGVKRYTFEGFFKKTLQNMDVLYAFLKRFS